jgi:hypothetical protein
VQFEDLGTREPARVEPTPMMLRNCEAVAWWLTGCSVAAILPFLRLGSRSAVEQPAIS